MLRRGRYVVRDDDVLLTARDVCEMVRISRRTLRAWVRRGEFPLPTVNRPRVQRWCVRDVRAWLGRVP